MATITLEKDLLRKVSRLGLDVSKKSRIAVFTDEEIVSVINFLLGRYDPSWFWETIHCSLSENRRRCIRYLRILDIAHLVNGPGELVPSSKRILRLLCALFEKLEKKHGSTLYQKPRQVLKPRPRRSTGSQQDSPGGERLSRAVTEDEKENDRAGVKATVRTRTVSSTSVNSDLHLPHRSQPGVPLSRSPPPHAPRRTVAEASTGGPIGSDPARGQATTASVNPPAATSGRPITPVSPLRHASHRPAQVSAGAAAAGATTSVVVPLLGSRTVLTSNTQDPPVAAGAAGTADPYTPRAEVQRPTQTTASVPVPMSTSAEIASTLPLSSSSSVTAHSSVPVLPSTSLMRSIQVQINELQKNIAHTSQRQDELKTQQSRLTSNLQKMWAHYEFNLKLLRDLSSKPSQPFAGNQSALQPRTATEQTSTSGHHGNNMSPEGKSFPHAVSVERIDSAGMASRESIVLSEQPTSGPTALHASTSWQADALPFPRPALNDSQHDLQHAELCSGTTHSELSSEQCPRLKNDDRSVPAGKDPSAGSSVENSALSSLSAMSSFIPQATVHQDTFPISSGAQPPAVSREEYSSHSKLAPTQVADPQYFERRLQRVLRRSELFLERDRLLQSRQAKFHLA